MIAADTSSLVAFLEGADGDDVELIQSALDHQQLVLPPVVLTELLSDPGLPAPVRSLLTALPQLQLEPGYWERAGCSGQAHQAASQGAHRRRAHRPELHRSVGAAGDPRQDFRHFASKPRDCR